MPLDVSQNRPISDIMITTDLQSPLKYHSRKMICKLREACVTDPLYAFYREFDSQMFSEEQKRGEHFAFLVNALLFNT